MTMATSRAGTALIEIYNKFLTNAFILCVFFSLIGVIVGVVLAVILLIVAIALLVFAKASNRWCFADDDYKNPNDARAHPNSRSGGGGMRRPANQVYRFILHLEQ